MASFEEFSTAVRSSIEALRQVQAGVDRSRQQAEELTAGFQMLGVESYAVTAYTWQEGVQQAQAMVEELIGQLEQLITAAEGMKSQGGATRAPEVRPSPTPLDAAPANLKEPVAKVGDPVTAPEPGPGSYQQELKPTDDGDAKMGKSRRVGRAMVRNISSIQGQAKDTAAVRTDTAMAFETIETVGVPEPAESINAGSATPVSTPDTVSTAVLAAAFAFEGLARILDRRRSRR